MVEAFAKANGGPNLPDPPTDVLRRENDFVLNKLTLTSYNGKEYNVAAHRVLLTYEESIFHSTIHGSLVMIDAVDYPTLMPIIGEERIKVSLTRQNENVPAGSDGELLPPLEFDARIYKISPREQQGTSDKMQIYTLYFCSDEFIKNVRTKVFRSFVSDKFSAIVETVFDESMKVNKPIVVEETKYDHQYCISNKEPVRVFKALAQRSVSAEGNGTFYVFFEDRDQFNFVTVGKLFTQAAAKTITYRVQNILEDNSGHKNRTIEEDINSVQHYHHTNAFDIVEEIAEGKGASRLITVDIVRQKFEQIDFDLDASFGDFQHLGNAKPFTSSSDILNCPEGHTKLVTTDAEHDSLEHITARDATIKPKHIEEYSLQRQSNVQQLKRHIVTLTMSGDPRVKVGQVVEFVLPELLGKVSEHNPQELDRYLQGKYLITSCAHVLSANNYSLNLELIKDSFFDEISHRDPAETYRDIY